MTTKSFQQRIRRQALRQVLIDCYGGVCQWVGCRRVTTLEFAHTHPTDLRGRSRGTNERLSDVQKNKACYQLLCRKHHRLYDGGSPLTIKEVL
jgi:hypothetical protein